MKITENFTISEFEHSDKAIEFGINNKVPKKYNDNIVSLCENVLQPLRDKFGPIIISSGYRCNELNEAVKGVSNSQHCKDEAADITATNATLMDVYRYIIEELDYDQCFLEKNSKGKKWIHVSFSRSSNRREYGKLNQK